MTIADNMENGVNASLPPLEESVSAMGVRLVSTYPLSLNWRPNGLSIEDR